MEQWIAHMTGKQPVHMLSRFETHSGQEPVGGFWKKTAATDALCAGIGGKSSPVQAHRMRNSVL